MLYEGALRVRKEVLGVTHIDTLKSMSNLATLYDGQGKYDVA